MRKIVLLTVLLLAVPFTVSAQSTCTELVPKVMDATGMTEGIADFPTMIQAVLADQMDRESSMLVDAKRAFESSVKNSFDVPRVTRNTKAKLMASCDATLYAAALQQMQSPLAQKMTQLELLPDTNPEERRRMQRYVASFAMQSPRESRMALIRRLIAAEDAAETYANNSVQLRIITDEAVTNTKVTKEQAAQLRAEALPGAQQMLEAKMYYIYRSVPDEELAQYIVLASTKEQKRITHDTDNALLFAASHEFASLGAQLRKIVLDMKAEHGE